MPQAPDSYADLTPDFVLDALDEVGLRGDGRLMQLNSYENRVFQIYLEDGRVVVAKFYRPGRWSDEQILEEHAFALELAAAEMPMVPPLDLGGRTSCGDRNAMKACGIAFAVSERHAGRRRSSTIPRCCAGSADSSGRLHAVGARRAVRAPAAARCRRPSARRRARCCSSRHRFPMRSGRAGRRCATRRSSAVRRRSTLPGRSRAAAARRLPSRQPAVAAEEGPHFVDLDDACTGPAVQDLWMLLSGDRASMAGQMRWLLDGYGAFMQFRRARAFVDRAAAHVAHDPPQRVDRGALGGPGVSRGVPVVRERGLLVAADDAAARAVGGDARGRSRCDAAGWASGARQVRSG